MRLSGNKETYWHDKADFQTNFYLEEVLYEDEEYRNGIGRYDYIKENLEASDSYAEFDTLINQITFGNVYDYQNCPYDLRTDLAGLYENATDYLLNEEKEKILMITSNY